MLRVVFGDLEPLEKVTKLMAWKKNLQTRYLPPTNLKGNAQGAVLVSNGVVVEEVEGESAAAMNKEIGKNNSSHPNESVNNSSHPSENLNVTESPEEVTIEGVINEEVEETRVEEVEVVLGVRGDEFSALGEVEGEPLVGSAET